MLYLRNFQSSGEDKDGIPWISCMVRERRLMYKQLPSKLSLSECGCIWLLLPNDVTFTFLKLSLFSYKKKCFPSFRTSCQQPHLRRPSSGCIETVFPRSQGFLQTSQVKFACPFVFPSMGFPWHSRASWYPCVVLCVEGGDLNAFFWLNEFHWTLQTFSPAAAVLWNAQKRKTS